MSITSTEFLLFVTGVFLVYFITPRKWQWVVLLAASLTFYYLCSKELICMILMTSLTVYGGAMVLEKIGKRPKPSEETPEEKKARKKRTARQKKAVLALVLLCNLGLWIYLKYGDFLYSIFAKLFSGLVNGNLDFVTLGLPMGISFYTLQAAGYLLDVYRGKYPPEKNPLKFTLFVSFFPTILQGPISRFDQLGKQLSQGHSFDFWRAKNAILLMGWGFMKIILLSDHLNTFIKKAFAAYPAQGTGGAIIFLASLLYGFQIYANFSGGVDISRGVSEMLGIRLTANFSQPYFATSVSDFWRRWHMTLGAWMRDYVFFPLSFSKPVMALGKATRKRFGGQWSKTIVTGILTFVVFTLVGIWHGSNWKYIAYGLYNGTLMMGALLLGPLFERGLKALHINPDSKGWHVFQMGRTLFLVTLGRCLVRAEGVKAALVAYRDMVFSPQWQHLTDGTLTQMGLKPFNIAVVLLLLVLVFLVDLISERGGNVREGIARFPLPVRWLIYLGIIFGLMLLMPVSVSGDLMYARF